MYTIGPVGTEQYPVESLQGVNYCVWAFLPYGISDLNGIAVFPAFVSLKIRPRLAALASGSAKHTLHARQKKPKWNTTEIADQAEVMMTIYFVIGDCMWHVAGHGVIVGRLLHRDTNI